MKVHAEAFSTLVVRVSNSAWAPRYMLSKLSKFRKFQLILDSVDSHYQWTQAKKCLRLCSVKKSCAFTFAITKRTFVLGFSPAIRYDKTPPSKNRKFWKLYFGVFRNQWFVYTVDLSEPLCAGSVKKSCAFTFAITKRTFVLGFFPVIRYDKTPPSKNRKCWKL